MGRKPSGLWIYLYKDIYQRYGKDAGKLWLKEGKYFFVREFDDHRLMIRSGSKVTLVDRYLTDYDLQKDLIDERESMQFLQHPGRTII